MWIGADRRIGLKKTAPHSILPFNNVEKQSPKNHGCQVEAFLGEDVTPCFILGDPRFCDIVCTAPEAIPGRAPLEVHLQEA